MKLTAEQRFWAKVSKRKNGCWVWTGSTRHYGYGEFYFQGRKYPAHRWLFEQTYGDVGDKEVCHKCDNPPCVNPKHLFAGTKSENLLDCSAKGRFYYQKHPKRSNFSGPNRPQPRGEQCGNAKLTRRKVLAIRRQRKAGVLARIIAKDFGISQAHVYKVASKQWGSHVK